MDATYKEVNTGTAGGRPEERHLLHTDQPHGVGLPNVVEEIFLL